MNRKELIIVFAITFIVVAIWIISDAYRNTKPSIPPDPKLQKIMDPVDPNFDEETIKAIKNPPVIQVPVITNPQPSEQPATGSAIPQ
ncbi:hypothetical protein HYW46_00620 [Candidatus Daviesbacteria bacterium]|nr:hypothetical protein [Candidatus Daviesbacteria bacterium]